MNEMIAKLLATEDITVVTANVKTASFDLIKRILTLPMWENMDKDTEDHLVGHEVGHSLYTPTDEWSEAVKGESRTFAGYLNVVEDARIEKKVMVRYPGLKRSFVKSYKKMLADGFFGGDIDFINSLPLIDRINSRFKLGMMAGVKFEKSEKEFVEAVDSVMTFSDAVAVASVLYEKARKEKEEEKAAESEMLGEDEGEFDDFDSEDLDFDSWGDGEEDESEDGSMSGSGEESEEEDESDNAEGSSGSPDKGEMKGTDSENDGTVANDSIDDEIESVTEQSLKKAIEEFNSDFTGNIMNFEASSPLASGEFILPYKETLKNAIEWDLIRDGYYGIYDEPSECYLNRVSDPKARYAEIMDGLYADYLKGNKSSISYMVKEFEMKKAATEYARTTLSKTGVIDPVKMNSYRYSDDIFRKMATVHNGKNHGMIMYVDWSGSMNKDIYPTMIQTLNLVNFCKAVNIPFRVFAFTDGYSGSLKQERTPNATMVNDRYKMLELFSNKMNKREFVRMSKLMLGLTKHISAATYGYGLNSTPLDATIFLGMKVHDEFKRETRVDIVNTIFLTDGMSHNFYGLDEQGYACEFNGWYHDIQRINFVDPLTRKKYRMPSRDKMTDITDFWLKIYRDHTGSNTIGFRIVGSNKRHLLSDLKELGVESKYWDNINEQIRKEKYAKIPSKGYNSFFAIPGGKNLLTETGEFEVAEDATRGKIATAFKKARKGKLSSRAMLNEFISQIATQI